MINSTLCYIYRRPGAPRRSGASREAAFSDREVLMLHRTKKKNDINHDKWIGIGGKFEEGESPEDCLLREAREETGLTLKAWRYRGIVTFVSDLPETEYMHLFTSDRFEGELIECDEGDLTWVRQEDFDALPQWEGDRIFLRLLDEGAPFFSLKLVYAGDLLTEAVLDGRRLDFSREKTVK